MRTIVEAEDRRIMGVLDAGDDDLDEQYEPSSYFSLEHTKLCDGQAEGT